MHTSLQKKQTPTHAQLWCMEAGSIVVGLLFPFVAARAYFGGVDTLFIRINGFINDILIPLVFTVALFAFLFGMVQYFVIGGGSDDSRSKGKQLMLWAIIGFVIMVSIWGIVTIISSGLFGSAGAPPIPGTPTI